MMRQEGLKDGMSLVVCCYNSAKRIKPTLVCLSSQRIKKEINFEIILVDNASTDDTMRVAHKFWSELKSEFSFRVVEESHPGLSSARKRGVLEARYSLVLFCDDDNWLSENYVQRAFEIMSSDSSIGILGGCGIPETVIQPPAWFEKYRKSYALGPQAKRDGYLPDALSIYGAGMVMRKELLLKMYALGFESALSDRKGDTLTSGGDIEICIWYRFLGYKLYYSGMLTFKHFIPEERLTEAYFLKRAYEKGKTEAVFQMYKLMMNGVGVQWLHHGYLWYWEIGKRMIYYLLACLSNSFDSKVKRNILKSSITFRVRNIHYLETVHQLISKGIREYPRYE